MTDETDIGFERALLRADIRAGNHEAAEGQLARVLKLEGKQGQHRPERDSTHCRYCGAHPSQWHKPCRGRKPDAEQENAGATRAEALTPHKETE